jgi:hypothetical protein
MAELVIVRGRVYARAHEIPAVMVLFTTGDGQRTLVIVDQDHS